MAERCGSSLRQESAQENSNDAGLLPLPIAALGEPESEEALAVMIGVCKWPEEQRRFFAAALCGCQASWRACGGDAEKVAVSRKAPHSSTNMGTCQSTLAKSALRTASCAFALLRGKATKGREPS